MFFLFHCSVAFKRCVANVVAFGQPRLKRIFWGSEFEYADHENELYFITRVHIRYPI